jgi:CheY-like chemotaxis protein
MNILSVLVVDDDPAIRELLKLVLQARGCDVVVAEDGRRASRALADGVFDLVVTDLLMPERDGLEFIREAHQAHPGMKIIAMSGGGHIASESYLKMAKAFGADALLEKPFDQEDLWRAIAAVQLAPPAGAPPAAA